MKSKMYIIIVVVFFAMIFSQHTNCQCYEFFNMCVKYRLAIKTDNANQKYPMKGIIIDSSEEGALRILSQHGYLDIGPQYRSFSHFQTNSLKFLFNKPVYVKKEIAINPYKFEKELADCSGDNIVNIVDAFTVP